MVIEAIQPDAVGPINDWTLGAGGSKPVATQLPDDDGTSYITSNTVGQIQEFECDDPSDILSADTIDSVTIKIRAQKIGGVAASVIFGLRVAGGTLDEGAIHALSNSYADFTDVFLTNPDSVAWSLADLNALRIRVRYESGSDNARVTTLVADIAYTRASDKSQHTMMLGVG